MRFFGTEVPDQYYAIVARLAAGGHQRTTMRLIAGCIITVTVPALLALANPAATRLTVRGAALIAVATVCLGLTVPWLRRRWPARAESVVAATIATFLLAAGCAVAANPLVGLLTATAFAFILGYVALFHGTPVQVCVAAVAALTVAWLTVQIAADGLSTALAVSIPVVMLIVAVTLVWRALGGMAAAGISWAAVEPTTGLPIRASIDELAATMLGARSRDDDRFMVVAVLSIDSVPALLSLQGRRGVDRVRASVAQAVRDTVRRDAVIGHLDATDFVIVDIFTGPDPVPMAERIRSSVATAPGGITASIGVVSTPLGPLAEWSAHDVLGAMLPLAVAAAARARARGGNQIDHSPQATLGGPPGPDSPPDQV